MMSSGGGGGSGGGSSSSSPCGACKFLRRKCISGCIFAPYFDSEQGAGRFAAVHKIFGASNVSKLLLSIPVHKRLDAVVTISYEAQSRIRDPVYGCVSHLFALQQQVANLQAELSYLHGHLAQLELPQPPPPPQMATTPPIFSMTDLPSVTDVAAVPAATYDLSALFDPAMMGQAASWAMQQRAMDPRLVHVTVPSSAATSAAIQAVARDIAHRHGPPPPSSSNASPSLSLSK